MPQSTAAERVAVHLGPAPIREVLSALLYGTDFNYVIQASEKDESGLGKVILIPRDGDKSDSAVASDAPGNPNIRLMPGYSAPGKRDYEVAHENAVDDAASPLEQPSVSEGAAPQEQNQAASTESASTAAPPSGTADAQPAPSNPDSADAAPPAADATMSAGEIQPSHNPAGLLSPSLPTPGEAPSISQMEQNLQNLYQQRRQLQAQQNHTAPAQGN
jgi:hypothetical protein